MAFVSIGRIFSASPEEVRQRLGPSESSDIRKLTLALADGYMDQGMLSARDEAILLSPQFRNAWMLSDEELLKYLTVPATRFSAALIASGIASTLTSDLISTTRVTYVFAEPKLVISDNITDILRSRGIVFSHSLPKVCPPSRDVIILIRGRSPQEVRDFRRPDYNLDSSGKITMNRYDPHIKTEDSERITTLIKKYGSFAKIIAIAGIWSLMDNWLACQTMATDSLEDAVDYILTPYDPSTENLTYYSSGTDGNNSIEEYKLLRSWRQIYKYNMPPYIDFVKTSTIFDVTQISSGRDIALWNIRSTLLNATESVGITMLRKDKLYSYMREVFDDADEFIPASSILQKDVSFNHLRDLYGDVCIVKPSGAMACSGIGITTVSSQEELQVAWERLQASDEICIATDEGKEKCAPTSAKKRDLTSRKIKWIPTVSRYIDNPLLYEGRKIHFRAYIISTTWGTSVWYSRFEVLLARDKYVKGDYLNTNIHDTHAASTNIFVLYPDDFDDDVVRKIQPSVDNIMNKLTRAFRSKSWPYPETKYSYMLYGIDILPTDDYKCWLIEVNSLPGMNIVMDPKEKIRKFQSDLASWIFKSAIEPIVNLMVTIKIVPMESSSLLMRKDLAAITAQPAIMAHVGKGQLWSPDYIEEMYRESVKDAQSSNSAYRNWIITNNDKTVGFIQIRQGVKFEGHKPSVAGTRESDYQVRIFLGEQRKGYGRRALSILNSEEPTKKLFAIVDSLNVPSLQLFLNSGFFKIVHKNVMAYGRKSTIFVRTK